MPQKQNTSANQRQQVEKSSSTMQRISRLFSRKKLMKNLPFLCFICLLAIIYIWNVHYTERTARDIEQISKELKKIRWKYMTTQAELMNISKQSKMTKLVNDIGLKPLETPPQKIVVNDIPVNRGK